MEHSLHPGKNAIIIQAVDNPPSDTELPLEDLSASWQPSFSNVALVTIAEDPRVVNKPGQEALTNALKLPSWFWNHSTEKASGFFHVRYNQQTELSEAIQGRPAAQTSRNDEVQTISRFLIKHYKETRNGLNNSGKIDYHWERLTFFCNWRLSGSKVICFLPADSKDGFMQFAFDKDLSMTTDSAFDPHIKVLEYVVSRFDQAVWGWRDVVRDREKSRPEPGTMNPDWLEGMHEVARHVIHTSEMLSTALNVTESLLGEVTTPHGERSASYKGLSSNESDMKYVTTMLQCILRRSQALEKRIQNELQLAFHRSTQHDSLTIQRDSLTMKTISVLGLLFLPGTFISAIFSMSFFNYTPENAQTLAGWKVSEDFWIYWVVAVPVTAATVVAWSLWQRHVDKASSLEGTSREVNIIERV